MKIHYNDYNGFNLSSKTLRTARKRMFNCSEFYKFHLLIDAELETNSDYTEIEKSKYNFSLFADNRAKFKLEDNYLIRAYNWGNENIYMHSLRRARACKRESNSVSKIGYYNNEFVDLIMPRYAYFNSKRELLEV